MRRSNRQAWISRVTGVRTGVPWSGYSLRLWPCSARPRRLFAARQSRGRRITRRRPMRSATSPTVAPQEGQEGGRGGSPQEGGRGGTPQARDRGRRPRMELAPCPRSGRGEAGDRAGAPRQGEGRIALAASIGDPVAAKLVDWARLRHSDSAAGLTATRFIRANPDYRACRRRAGGPRRGCGKSARRPRCAVVGDKPTSAPGGSLARVKEGDRAGGARVRAVWQSASDGRN